MESCAWTNGQIQPHPQHPQAATQLSRDMTRNRQAWTANHSCQNRTPSTFHSGASHQTSTVYHQAVSSPQPAANANPNKPFLLNMLLCYAEKPTVITPQEYPPLLLTNGLQVVPQQNFHQNSAQNSSPPNVMKSNTAYAQQDLSAHLNQSIIANGNVGNVVSNLRRSSLTAPVSAYTSSLPREQAVCSRTAVTSYNQNHQQNSSQHASSPSIPPPSYHMFVSQHFRKNSRTTNSPSSEQILHASLNPAADKQQEERMIAKIANELRNSYPAGSVDRGPVYSHSHNSNTSQSVPLNSGQYLPQSAHSWMSVAQHRGDVQLQQNSAPTIFYVAATGDGSKATNAFFPETQSSVANNHEMLKVNDSSISSSPGRAGVRAVAVVQPLSQESCQVARKQTSSNTPINPLAECNATEECFSNPEKVFISPAAGSDLWPENSNKIRSNNSVISLSAAPSGGTFVSSSGSARHQDRSQKRICADDTRSELIIDMQVDQRVPPTAQQSAASEVPVNLSADKDRSDPEPLVFELSSVPATPWTLDKLEKLVLDGEKDQMRLQRDFTEFENSNKMYIMFWNGKSQNLVSKLQTGWYRDLITHIREFTSQHETSNSVVLSQVKHVKQLKHYHVLKDDEVYKEPPYKSSWLNINEQLDDIDKEFGFRRPLTHRLHTLESGDDPHQVRTGNSNPAQIISIPVSEASNKVLSQTEPEPADSGEEQRASTVEVAASPNETSADSSEPFFSFEIKVLPPEEAKAIYEQVQSNVSQSVGADSQPERVMKSSVDGELPEVINVTVSDSKPKKKSLKEICCLSRWMEKILGSKTTECQCKNKQSHKDSTEQSPDKEEKLCVIKPDNKGKENFTEDNGPQIISLISFNRGQPSITFTSENKDEEPVKDSEQAQMKVTGSSEKETPKISRSCTEIQSDPAVDLVKDQSAGGTLSCTLVCGDTDTENLSSSESEDNRGEAQLTSPDVSESSMETEEQTGATPALQTTVSPHGKNETVRRKRTRPSTRGTLFPFLTKSNKYRPPGDVDRPVLEGFSKRREVLVNATDGEPSASNGTTVELVLFGSSPQSMCPLNSGRRGHISSEEAVSDGAQRPPKVITVRLSPLKRKFSETVLTRECSVKRWIHEKWRRSLPPAKIRHRCKLKAQKCTFASSSGLSLRKAETVGRTEEPPVSSETRTWTLNTKRCPSLKKRGALSNGLKRGEEKTKKDAAALKQRADRERRNADDGRHAAVSVKENAVLRFSVLPNTFSFTDGSNGRQETSDVVPDESDFVKEKDKSLNMTAARTRGTWSPNPEKKYFPLFSPPAPKTSSLFHEFQKKYREKAQPCTDE